MPLGPPAEAPEQQEQGQEALAKVKVGSQSCMVGWRPVSVRPKSLKGCAKARWPKPKSSEFGQPGLKSLEGSVRAHCLIFATVPMSHRKKQRSNWRSCLRVPVSGWCQKTTKATTCWLFFCVVVAFVVSPSLSPFFFGVFDTHAKERLTRTCHENAKSDSSPARN